MIIYTSFREYIESKAKIEERLTLIEQAIDALMLKTLDTADKADLKEYQLDDGQTKIRVAYSNIAEVMIQINALERLKQMYINRLAGRTFRLIDSKNFY